MVYENNHILHNSKGHEFITFSTGGSMLRHHYQVVFCLLGQLGLKIMSTFTTFVYYTIDIIMPSIEEPTES